MEDVKEQKITYHIAMAKDEVTNCQNISALVYVAFIYMFITIQCSLVIFMRRRDEIFGCHVTKNPRP
jgi:hypothetical protein